MTKSMITTNPGDALRGLEAELRDAYEIEQAAHVAFNAAEIAAGLRDPSKTADDIAADPAVRRALKAQRAAVAAVDRIVADLRRVAA